MWREERRVRSMERLEPLDMAIKKEGGDRSSPFFFDSTSVALTDKGKLLSVMLVRNG